ncbi:hypothetical protein [Streptomyces sp. NBC_00286]|uniref:hypothetical protein n=1 Tax=Streptomyces sp. NBC_00286 TaxID=2975701 RepID=UPI002E2AD4C3|nr:hypothetical protein [Streptomyces sp. NBC_00286]
MSDLERITARRSELDALAEELAKRLQEVEAEREELGIAELVLDRRPNKAGLIRRRWGGGPDESAGGGACGAADPAPR